MALSQKYQAGFTLVEMVMTIVVMSIISIILARIMLNGFNTFGVGYAGNNVSSQALMGVERMVYDLRNASSITTVASSSFTFVDQTGTSYTYSVSGSTLARGSNTLVDSLQSLSLTYLDENGTSTLTASAVNYVNISMTLSSNNIPVTLTTLVCLRGVF